MPARFMIHLVRYRRADVDIGLPWLSDQMMLPCAWARNMVLTSGDTGTVRSLVLPCRSNLAVADVLEAHVDYLAGLGAAVEHEGDQGLLLVFLRCTDDSLQLFFGEDTDPRCLVVFHDSPLKDRVTKLKPR